MKVAVSLRQEYVMAGLDTTSKLATDLKNGQSDQSARLEALEHELRLHRAEERSRSCLKTVAAALSNSWTHAQESGAEIEKAVSSVHQFRDRGDTKGLEDALERSDALIRSDRNVLNQQAQFGECVSEFVRAVPFFMRGKAGVVGAATACALDQINPHDDARTVTLDGALGATKGVLLNGAYSKVARLDLAMPVAGVALGMSSRALDTALSKESYINKENGSISLSRAGNRLGEGLFSPMAVSSDFASYAVSRTLLGTCNRMSGGALQKSFFWTTVGTGTTTGFTAGGLSELERQRDAGEGLKLGQVFEHSSRSALLSGLAAVVAGGHNSLKYGRDLVALPVVRPFDVTDPYQFSLRAKDSAIAGIFERSEESIPRIIVEKYKVELPSGTLQRYGSGSGFVFSSDGRIATANHVIAGGGRIEIEFPGQPTRNATVQWADPQNDLAVLKLEEDGQPFPKALNLDSSGKPPARFSALYALGHPLGMEDVRVSQGVMRGNLPIRERGILAERFQRDCPMWWSFMPAKPGNSGGPVLNKQGEVVGVLSMGDMIAPHGIAVPVSKLLELDARKSGSTGAI